MVAPRPARASSSRSVKAEAALNSLEIKEKGSEMAPFLFTRSYTRPTEKRCFGLAYNTFIARALTRVLVLIAKMSEKLKFV